MHEARLIADVRNGTGESPFWDEREQALYWVDIPAGRLYRWQEGDVRHWQASQMIGCAVRAPGNRWLAAMETGVFLLSADADGQLRGPCLAQVRHARPAMRFNDGRCDRQGRFWAGTMELASNGEPVGKLYKLDEDGTLQAVIDELVVPNGLAFSPDGRTMYLSDSHVSVQKIWAFDYDIATGMPRNRRLFVDMNQHPGRPDGAAVDAEGGYWTCANDAGLLLRFTPEGVLDRQIEVPVRKPAMCAFGGAELETLFVTSIRPDNTDQPLAGGLFAAPAPIRGLGEPQWRATAPA